MGRKRWNRIEEAEDILDQVYELLNQIPIRDLKNEVMWVPSTQFVSEIEETKDRVHRYMKRHKLNGWKEMDEDADREA